MHEMVMLRGKNNRNGDRSRCASEQEASYSTSHPGRRDRGREGEVQQ